MYKGNQFWSTCLARVYSFKKFRERTLFNSCMFDVDFCLYFFLDFDEDDPLAGLLSDDEDEKPKKRSATSAAQKTVKSDMEKERPHTGPKQDDSLPASMLSLFAI